MIKIFSVFFILAWTSAFAETSRELLDYARTFVQARVDYHIQFKDMIRSLDLNRAYEEAFYVLSDRKPKPSPLQNKKMIVDTILMMEGEYLSRYTPLLNNRVSTLSADQTSEQFRNLLFVPVGDNKQVLLWPSYLKYELNDPDKRELIRFYLLLLRETKIEEQQIKSVSRIARITNERNDLIYFKSILKTLRKHFPKEAAILEKDFKFETNFVDSRGIVTEMTYMGFEDWNQRLISALTDLKTRVEANIEQQILKEDETLAITANMLTNRFNALVTFYVKTHDKIFKIASIPALKNRSETQRLTDYFSYELNPMASLLFHDLLEEINVTTQNINSLIKKRKDQAKKNAKIKTTCSSLIDQKAGVIHDGISTEEMATGTIFSGSSQCESGAVSAATSEVEALISTMKTSDELEELAERDEAEDSFIQEAVRQAEELHAIFRDKKKLRRSPTDHTQDVAQEDPYIVELKKKLSHATHRKRLMKLFDHQLNEMTYHELLPLVELVDGEINRKSWSHFTLVLPGGLAFPWQHHGRKDVFSLGAIKHVRHAFEQAGITPEALGLL